MQEQSYGELSDRAVEKAMGRVLSKCAETAVRGELEAMRIEDKILLISDEEERMIRSFRRFKIRMRKNGEVFKWQTVVEPGVLIPEETAFIVDPQEA